MNPTKEAPARPELVIWGPCLRSHGERAGCERGRPPAFVQPKLRLVSTLINGWKSQKENTSL